MKALSQIIGNIVMSVIVALSGGKASAWCADWALRHYKKEDVILYFNDTKWEHEDLYRFLNDLSTYFKHPITFDSDGRSPEDLFYDKCAIANNRMPFCSRILKAERLQKFYKHKDVLIFGIGHDEEHRANRLYSVYQGVANRTNKWPLLVFPLIREAVTNDQIDAFLSSANIQEPLLYRLGFKHNNCSGGCVRAGKASWKLLLEKLPTVYAERERVEKDIREYIGKDVSIFKDETLEEFRLRISKGDVSNVVDDGDTTTECVGICSTMT